MIVWDLDGVLVETRQAHLLAYRAVGVEPPGDFHVRHWTEFCSQAQHDAKCAIVEQHLREHAASTDLLQQVGPRDVVLTSTSLASLKVLVSMFPQLEILSIHWGYTTDEKLDWLRRCRPVGTYVDDHEPMLERVRALGWSTRLAIRMSSWMPEQSRAPNPRFMGYTGDACSNCGGMRMRVAGHCLCCDDCGTTTGCS